MIAQGNGHVVNLASMAGKIPFPGMAVYNASKYAAVGLTAAVRRELHGTGVTVSAVLPSAVRTSLSSGVRLGGLLPTVDPTDVAAAILRTCHTRQAEIAVPRWLTAWKVLDGLTPSSLMTLGRRLQATTAASPPTPPPAPPTPNASLPSPSRERLSRITPAAPATC